jgi:hypothetical protein
MAWDRAMAVVLLGGLASLSLLSCSGTRSSAVHPGGPQQNLDPRPDAYARLLDGIELFRVAGAIKTSDGLLLPEAIMIEIKSEICVESRQPGTRFWSLDYDTCFAYTAVDSLNQEGEYSVSVPCLDADRVYESSFSFGDLRLVQRGPVSFVASSDAGWRHHETFTSSRTQRRDLILTLDTDTFYVVRDQAAFRDRPRSEANVIQEYQFGTGVEVVRFHQGWAQCLMGRHLGWMEMRFLGTEREMKELAPIKAKEKVEALPGSS